MITKKIKLQTGIASPSWSYAPEQVITVGEDIDEQTAQSWVRAGIAVPVAEPVIEKAVIEPSERATAGPKRRKAGK